LLCTKTTAAPRAVPTVIGTVVDNGISVRPVGSGYMVRWHFPGEETDSKFVGKRELVRNELAWLESHAFYGDSYCEADNHGQHFQVWVLQQIPAATRAERLSWGCLIPFVLLVSSEYALLHEGSTLSSSTISSSTSAGRDFRRAPEPLNGPLPHVTAAGSCSKCLSPLILNCRTAIS
jgi:hypothetical protein